MGHKHNHAWNGDSRGAMNVLSSSGRECDYRIPAGDLPMPVICYDATGQRLSMNAAAMAMMSVPSGDSVGPRSESELLSRPALRRYLRAVGEVAATGVPTTLELAFDAVPVAECRHYRVQLAATPAPDGGVNVLAVWFDVTASKQAEAQLREREAFLETLLDMIPVPVFSKNREGRYLYLNKAFEEFLGRKKADFIGKTVFEAHQHELANTYHANDDALFRDGGVQRYESTVRNASDHVREVEFTKSVFHDREGTPAGLIGAILDVTERQQAEAERHVQYENMLQLNQRLEGKAWELEEARSHLLGVLQTIPDFVWLKDAEGVYLFCNPAYERLLGKPEAEIVGKSDGDFYNEEEAAFCREKDLQAIDAGRICINEEWVTYPDTGRRALLETRKVPMRAADGRVKGVLGVARDITERKRFEDALHRMAYYDPLTSLPNRTLFNERLRQTVADALPDGCPLSGVVMLDMDRFKDVNDTFGHAAGDELLREAAKRLLPCVRPGDTVARLGGDEFAILLPDVRERRMLENIAKTILRQFDEHFELNGKGVFVSCSIGIALYPNDSTEAGDLLKYADSAMYFAKQSGRRGYRFYSKELTVHAAKRVALESELRGAIERGEFELHYQPKVSLDSNEVIGSEALLRWNRPGTGLVLPNEFIPVAEETGLIGDLGTWVLREACRAAVEWNADGGVRHTVAVNLSARQFQFQDLASTVEEILVETGCRPEWLGLEITESLLLEEDDAVLAALWTFKTMGLSIAVDDFGTGYSALSYLARFPIDVLKIDRSFVQKVTTDRRHAELVKAILSIARCLGQQVVAEGVETDAQAEFLSANGCQIAQGFLYSVPLPKSRIPSLPRRLGGLLKLDA
ncbi:diguanylate cyclase [Burkholderia multivorans]